MNDISTLITAVSGLIAAISVIYTLYLKNRKPKKFHDTDRLVDHAIFIELDRFLFSFKTRDICDDVVKNEVLKLIIIKKIEAGKKYLYEVAEKLDNECDMKCDICPRIPIMKKLNSDALHSIVSSYNTFHNNGNFLPGEVEMIDYALRQFNEIHDPATQMVENSIDMLDVSYMYTDCTKTMQSMLFNMYLAAFTLTFKDISETSENINGYYHGKHFRKQEYKI